MTKLLAWLFAAGKLGKVLTTGGTMIISMATYALIYGWRFAIGFVLLIFCHEMGHYLAARYKGLDVGAPTFIPFVGAWIQLKNLPHDAHTEAFVGIAGPAVGTLAALACYGWARMDGDHFLLALAYTGFMLNLFNMIPVSPLDGGRITAVISPKIWLLGAPLLAVLFLYNPSPMLILIAVLAFPQLKAALQKDSGAPSPGYYDAPLDIRLNYALYYFGLTAYLAVMTFEVHKMLS